MRRSVSTPSLTPHAPAAPQCSIPCGWVASVRIDDAPHKEAEGVVYYRILTCCERGDRGEKGDVVADAHRRYSEFRDAPRPELPSRRLRNGKRVVPARRRRPAGRAAHADATRRVLDAIPVAFREPAPGQPRQGDQEPARGQTRDVAERGPGETGRPGPTERAGRARLHRRGGGRRRSASKAPIVVARCVLLSPRILRVPRSPTGKRIAQETASVHALSRFSREVYHGATHGTRANHRRKQLDATMAADAAGRAQLAAITTQRNFLLAELSRLRRRPPPPPPPRAGGCCMYYGGAAATTTRPRRGAVSYDAAP